MRLCIPEGVPDLYTRTIHLYAEGWKRTDLNVGTLRQGLKQTSVSLRR